jgi:transposase
VVGAPPLRRRQTHRDRHQRSRAAIRPISLNRKNALFAGSDQGGVHWGVIASLIETCKLNAVDPQAYLADVLSRLVNRHPASQIDHLMPWAYTNQVA